MRCFKGCFGSKETKKLLQNQHQQPLLSCNEEEEEIIEPVKVNAVLRSEIKSKEKINSSSETKPTRAYVDDDENLIEDEKPEIKNKNREENDKDGNGGGGGSCGTLHSISNDINTSNINDPKNLLQERIVEDQKTTSMDSTESLFSLSIDSREQFWTIITEEQQGDKEVNSPLKDITSRVESNDKNHSHFEEHKVEVQIDGKKKPLIRHEDDKENMKSDENRIKHTMKEKNSNDHHKLKPLSSTKENVIDTASFSSWLGGGSSENTSLKRRRSNNPNNSPDSEKNYEARGSVKVERKEFRESSESLSVSCGVGDEDDDRYSEGTIGRYLQTKKIEFA